MACQDYPYAGLILPDARDLDPGPYLAAAEIALARHDPVPDGRPHRPDAGNFVPGHAFGVTVLPEEQSDFGPRVLIEVTAADGGPPDDDETASAILSDTVLLALEKSSADILEWYAPDMLIDRADFLRLRACVAPRRGDTAAPDTPDTSRFQDTDAVAHSLMACEEIAAGLRRSLYPDDTPEPVRPKAKAPRRARPRLRLPRKDRRSPAADNPVPAGEPDAAFAPLSATEQPEMATAGNDGLPPLSDPLARYSARLAQNAPQRRLLSAGWLMTGVLGIVAAPVAASVAVVSLFRGMDLRLVSQSLAVTGLFVVLYNTDRLEQVMQRFLN